MNMKHIIISLDPFLARKIEVVAVERGIDFHAAVFFLIQSVITPETDIPESGLVQDLVI